MIIRVQSDPFDVGATLNSFAQDRRDIGAVVSFTGVVRDTQDDLHEMQIEHYPGMTESAIKTIAQDAVSRWRLADILVIHRYGNLKPGAPIMMVATAAAHRVAAFEAADFMMDYLKSRAPFWKKEITQAGASWVASKDADEDALKRW
ncbi:molybdopterin synthase subunit MoaE [Yoonia tamlensis]|uniref:Molybdopterin synthase catalytic subunit n=1 Tax=Yoonia tamlensis TaxID=390270 RepID=A0A1I6I0U3_9RHOB|nr:molybdenum cofactor biosynthesis protein MoaE [Yoonia tamlensis]SFR60284.1 molybdopterin synthase subunit MoaE [Yoonia tamlensis]